MMESKQSPPSQAAAQPPRPPAPRHPQRPAPQSLADLSQFAALLDRQLGQCRRYGVCAAVLLLTVAPQTEGPQPLTPATLEALLEAVGARLISRVRGTDVAVQVGEFSFGLVLLEAGRPEVDAVSERLQKALCGPYGVHEQRLRVQLHIGTAVFREAGLLNGRALVEAAAARQSAAPPLRLALVGD